MRDWTEGVTHFISPGNSHGSHSDDFPGMHILIRSELLVSSGTCLWLHNEGLAVQAQPR